MPANFKRSGGGSEKTKSQLWAGWRRRMGLCSKADLRQARAWFEELYQAGLQGANIPTHLGMPPTPDEHQVYELGWHNAGRGRRHRNDGKATHQGRGVRTARL